MIWSFHHQSVSTIQNLPIWYAPYHPIIHFQVSSPDKWFFLNANAILPRLATLYRILLNLMEMWFLVLCGNSGPYRDSSLRLSISSEGFGRQSANLRWMDGLLVSRCLLILLHILVVFEGLGSSFLAPLMHKIYLLRCALPKTPYQKPHFPMLILCRNLKNSLYYCLWSHSTHS